MKECYIGIKNYIYGELLKAHLCCKEFHHPSKRFAEILVNPKEFLDFLISFPFVSSFLKSGLEEDELLALVQGGLRVINGEEAAKVY